MIENISYRNTHTGEHILCIQSFDDCGLVIVPMYGDGDDLLSVILEPAYLPGYKMIVDKLEKVMNTPEWEKIKNYNSDDWRAMGCECKGLIINEVPNEWGSVGIDIKFNGSPQYGMAVGSIYLYNYYNIAFLYAVLKRVVSGKIGVEI